MKNQKSNHKTSSLPNASNERAIGQENSSTKGDDFFARLRSGGVRVRELVDAFREAQKIHAKSNELKDWLEETPFTGESGEGWIKVTLNGHYRPLSMAKPALRSRLVF
jgi:hypothetical protein